MVKEIEDIKTSLESFNIKAEEDLGRFRKQYIGKESVISELYVELKSMSVEDKKRYNAMITNLKNAAKEKYQQAKDVVVNKLKSQKPNDITIEETPIQLGGRHPIYQTQNKILQIFDNIGFEIVEGPEIENDWYNFSSLNFEENHPAREMQDTFFIQKDPDILLRTHTSNTQTRIMENGDLPIRSIAHGRCYRNEDISSRSHAYFNQIEILEVGEHITLSNMKQTLSYFIKSMFGDNISYRLRPSYFPFTEISMELDISCLICGGDGCKVCKDTGWVEILGCGMVDPQVLKNCNIDPEKYKGYAIGMGVERIVQLIHQIPDIRLFSENDMRFLSQFREI